MLVQILVFAAALAIMSAVVLPGRVPARSTGHGGDGHGADGHGGDAPGGDAHATADKPAAGGAAGSVYTVVIVLILCLVVAAGFVALANMKG